MQARSVGVVCSFSSCRPGAFGAVLQFQLVQARSVGVAFYARADQERLVPCCSFSSCRQGALVLPFMLVQTRSVWCRVAVSARAGKELCFMQFRLVQTRSIVSYSLGSCGQGALVRAV
ncbi:hypothetical protein ACFX2I_029632 [Malus domestica]